MRAFLVILLLLLMEGFTPRPAGAALPGILRIGAPLCHAVTPLGAPAPAPSAYRCAGKPSGYQHGTLWLRAQLDPSGEDRRGLNLLVRQTRLERLNVVFGYADGGTKDAGTVRRGDFGDHWRIGGQIAFPVPARAAPIAWVQMRLDGLSDADLLLIRLFTRPDAARDLSLMAVMMGGALTLLLLGTIYSLSLAIAIRRSFVAWHAAWAICLLVWGLLWSQLGLLLVPGIAGMTALRFSTLISALAIACATSCAMANLAQARLPRHVRTGVNALGWLVALVGAGAAYVTDARLATFGAIIAALVLADVAAVITCIAVAWWRGSKEARDFALAWLPPMVVLALVHIFDFSGSLAGGGQYLAVLLASAMQTVWLAVAVTLRLSHLRLERDAAQHAQRELNELARRDPLTGLLNRRGFVDRATAILEGAQPETRSFSLLLIDIDHFKTVNDRYGHDAGDAVLQRIADRLRAWEGELCFAGRLGGEEFVLGLPGIEGPLLLQFAESVREGLATCRHAPPLAQGEAVTASIGVASVAVGTDFRALYKAADMALYEAKRQGRNRVVSSSAAEDMTSFGGRRTG